MGSASLRSGTMGDAVLLTAERLSVTLRSRALNRALVEDVSFEVGPECVALVGESGSGKSLTSRALMNLIRPPLHVAATQLRMGDLDLNNLSPSEWNTIRGRRLGLMLQDPRHSLNPVLNVGRQLDLALSVHARWGRARRQERIAGLLRDVGFEDPGSVLRSYPHQLSGGMGQRVVLAMALLNDPDVLIADEPTSALDGELREQVMALILRHVQERRMGLLLISHDLNLVSRHAARILVMHRGRIVDHGTGADIARSGHPYTRALWGGRPSGRTYGSVLPVFDGDALAYGSLP